MDYTYTNERCPECNAKMIAVGEGERKQIWCEREYLVVKLNKPYTPDDLKE
jgi:hypothetical protein